MISDTQKEELVAEFSELSEDDIVLPKEVYAHFGLLFFKFSLVEHSLINALMFHHIGQELAAKRIKTKAQWEEAHDRGYDGAKKKTFGNLVKAIVEIQEFAPFANELTKIKSHRDYFAHHFFREEVGMYRSDEGCWHVLWAIKQLRDQILKLDCCLERPTKAMCKRLGVPYPSDEILEKSQDQLIDEAQARIDTGNPFAWLGKKTDGQN